MPDYKCQILEVALNGESRIIAGSDEYLSLDLAIRQLRRYQSKLVELGWGSQEKLAISFVLPIDNSPVEWINDPDAAEQAVAKLVQGE